MSDSGGPPAAIPPAPAPTPMARQALADAVAFARGADAENTRRAYASDWRDFADWCAEAGLQALPAAPETVASYLACLALTRGCALATLRRRVVTIARAHRQAGHAGFWPGHPAISDTLRGIARQHGRPQRRAAALTTPEIRRLVASCGDDLAGLRDRTLILLGYAGALRRAEIIGVDVEHIST